MNGVTVDEARLDLARRHGYESWDALTSHVEALRDGSEPPPPFMLAYRAVEEADRAALVALLDAHPELIQARGTNGNDLLGMAGDLELIELLLERGADPNRGNDYGWTKLHQAGYSNRPELAQLMLDAGGRLDLSARGDGGTPLIAALFWGHREVVPLLGLEPGNLRVAAGLGLPELIDELAGTPRAGAHRAFYRPHGGFPAWEPTDDPQEVLDEALVWAAKADRVTVLPQLVGLGARVEADPYRGTRPDLGGRQRPRRLDPEARRARSRPGSARDVRRARPTAKGSLLSTSPHREAETTRSRHCSSSVPIRRSTTRSTTALPPAGPTSRATPSSPPDYAISRARKTPRPTRGLEQRQRRGAGLQRRRTRR